VTKARRYALEARAASLASWLVHRLPRKAALALGRGLGRLIGAIDRRHLAIAADNLRHAFPDWNEARVLHTAHAVYAQFGQVLFDILWLEGRSRDEVLALCDVEGREHIDAIMGQGRGGVMVTAHFGNWELQGLVHAWMYSPMAVVARALDNPELDRRLCAFRQTAGNTVIYKDKALARVLRSLRSGGHVAFLIDQNVQEKDGIFVKFFGRPAATTTVAAAVALKTGCPFVLGHAVLKPDGRYRMIYDPPLVVAETDDRNQDIQRLTQELTRRIEAWVREVPEQWLWIHRRWKTQPAAGSTFHVA
jgi:KDO2-lipid IV(A) lauroyltransferase